ncbi:MAG TPA: GWxTD domain-containing protein [Cyclobacteriaceae bacterium]|nr:GWxTD domain-containing protein [Cyclobacteriaceae bacterium]
MIYRILVGFFCLLCLNAGAQALREINYKYMYPNSIFTFDWKVTKMADGFKVYYEVRQDEPTQNIAFSIKLETRGSLADKNGNPIAIPTAPKQPGALIGSADFQAGPEQNILVARITVSGLSKDLQYTFHKVIPKNNSQYMLANQRVLLKNFVKVDEPLKFEGFNTSDPLQISYYDVSFPPAAPAFSNTMAKVPKTFKPDSLFSVSSDASLSLTKKGLYLTQQDTSSAAGIAFRVEDDYPKLNTIESLAGPLIYICTKQEGEKLKQVGNDKKKFDQLILNITGNSDRAKIFIRNYYKRVELANQYFSSYKEGWKTDRGMIFIIFGLPDEVYLFEDREVWDYKTTNAKARFQFIKSPSLFDPDNYVLIRDKKFTDPWYETIDLWRKARL